MKIRNDSTSICQKPPSNKERYCWNRGKNGHPVIYRWLCPVRAPSIFQLQRSWSLDMIERVSMAKRKGNTLSFPVYLMRSTLIGRFAFTTYTPPCGVVVSLLVKRMDSFLYVTCMNESKVDLLFLSNPSMNSRSKPFPNTSNPTLNTHWKKSKKMIFYWNVRSPSKSRLFTMVCLDLRAELEQRYTALEELHKSGNKYDQAEIDKELETLEKLQMKYNKIEAKRKKLAKQNHDRVRSLNTVPWSSTIFIRLDFEVCRGLWNRTQCIENRCERSKYSINNERTQWRADQDQYIPR